ncbi:SHOCT domain-containing protein [Dactylosporangium darangshiense]|uniref:SHOCT domain-containing protein n=1 Tax=Dactylosporangium darangshiense TaxID=579108 RepID=UPI0031E708F4
MHLVRKVLGTLLAIACFGLALYALFRLIQGGSCASGGNYVSARQCPPGTGWWAFELPVGIVGGLLFLGVGYVRFGRAEPTPTMTNPRGASTLNAQMFTAGGDRPAAWPSSLPWPPAGVNWQNATVVQMSDDGSGVWGGPEAPQTPGTSTADQDPLVRLERLRVLRDANALTPAEYDEAKAKILGQM